MKYCEQDNFENLALPPPSIIKKIEKYDPGAPADIFEGAETICRLRLEAAAMEVERRGLRGFIKGVVGGLRSFFNDIAGFHVYTDGPKAMIAPPKDNLNDVFVYVGNDLRAAIRGYLSARPDIAEKINLTHREETALEPIAGQPTSNYARWTP